MTELVPNAHRSLTERKEYSEALAASDLLPKQYRNAPANVLVALEYGNALGLSPMAAIQGIHVVEGKPTASAQLIGALVRNAGHRLRVQGDETHAVVNTPTPSPQTPIPTPAAMRSRTANPYRPLPVSM